MSENTQRDYIPMSVEENDPIKLEVDVARIIRGISPTVETERLENGARITITDLDGEHVAEIYDVTAENAERAAAAQEAAEEYAESAAQSATNAAASESSAATSEANAAASESNAANSASSASESAAMAVSSATAAVNANAAIQGMGVNSTTLEAGTQATVTKIVDPVTGAITLSFGLPKGEKGDAGMTMHICSSSEYDSQTIIPTIQNPDSNTFYLVPAENGSSPDLFVEWIYTNGAWEMFGSASIDLSGYITDVQVAGTSVVTDGVANVPLASSSKYGVVKVGGDTGIGYNANDQIAIAASKSSDAKAGTSTFKPIVPAGQHTSVFYGLAKAAGADMKDISSTTVGVYPDAQKTAIRSMLGATSDQIVAVQDTTPTDPDTKLWINETPASTVQVPTVAEMNTALSGKVGDVQVNGTSVVTDGVANVPILEINQYGVAKIGYSSESGLEIASNGNLRTSHASASNIKSAISSVQPITPDIQHASTFFGLSKVAGVDLANETVTVGTYPETSKTAIRGMLGAVGDVQVNGTSIITNGVANIPFAGQSTPGVIVATPYYGVYTSSEYLRLYKAEDSDIKGGTQTYRPIVPNNQHASTFYGLAKAAGDTTQSQSSNAVGTYTDAAKLAIQQMLGIDLSSIASQVEIPLVETVSGTVVNITGYPNTRYVCGEVTTIDVTPPASGSIDVLFESGSTAAVLTVPNTVKWPSWFDATSLDTNTTYEILITDGVYGSVMSWAT